MHQAKTITDDAGHEAVELREMAVLASMGLATLALCSFLGGCAITRVDARPATIAVPSVSIVSMETAFPMPEAERSRLESTLVASVGAAGQIVTASGNAGFQMLATVERSYHHDKVSGGLHNASTTYFDYGTYRIHLVLLDDTGTQVGSASVESDEDLGVLAHDPKREEALLAQGFGKAAHALFTRAAPTVASR